jgi:hypothetical protein
MDRIMSIFSVTGTFTLSPRQLPDRMMVMAETLLVEVSMSSTLLLNRQDSAVCVSLPSMFNCQRAPDPLSQPLRAH